MLYRSMILWLGLLTARNSFSQNLTFPAFLSQYVRENRLQGPETGIPIIVITTRVATRCELVISMFGLLSQVTEHWPADYTYIDGQLLLVYDGREQLYPRPTQWQYELKKAIGPQLCDNTVPILVDQHKERPIPCMFKYDPLAWKLTFTNGLLSHQELYQGELFK